MDIALQPYSIERAASVFLHLDDWDFAEACAVRGRQMHYLELLAEWHSAQGWAVKSWVFAAPDHVGIVVPFALLTVANTGQAGVGQGAFMARTHRRWRRALGRAAGMIRDGLPAFADHHGIYRIEARCHAGHPTASRFLSATGFRHEADMPGFGAADPVTFRQFAWTPEQKET